VSDDGVEPIDVLGLSRDALFERLNDVLDRRYRADQIWDGLYRHGHTDFGQMTTLSKSLRTTLGQRCTIGVPEIAAEHLSVDGTRKLLFRLRDGATVEAVDIPSEKRQTLCLSSQAGCALACTFCVTGYWGAGRNLSSGEIVAQVLGILGRLPFDSGVNVVMMGMGEPLHNLDNVREALTLLSEAISWRRMTVSTVGAVDGILRMASWTARPNLAVSLHAPDDERRSRIMPINRTHPLDELFAVLRDYPLERGRRLTFEYLLIRGFNDSLDDARLLSRRLDGLRSKVNLIPVNPDPVLSPEMVPSPPTVVEAFAARLRDLGVTTTVRRRRGDDVSAACGQLRAPGRPARGFRRSNLSF
jgi:23S rRNA (adenine2503-C2)-methyltransferase